MKVFTFLTLLFLTTGLTYSQDCQIYFPQKEGTVMEVTEYNPKGKAQSTSTTTIEKREVSGSNVTITAVSESITDSDTVRIEYTAQCKDGVFSFNMFPGMGNQGGSKFMEIEGDYLDFPKTPKAGMTLEDKTMTIRFTAGESENGEKAPGINLNYTFSNRKVEAVETLKTPAGSFDTFKMSYDLTMKMGINITYRIVEWYSLNIGMVRSELYNKKGKLKSYSELTKLDD